MHGTNAKYETEPARAVISKRLGLALSWKRIIGSLALASLLGAQSAPAFSQQPAPFKIGVLSDLSGPVAGYSGPGTLLSVKMAVEDFGGKVLDRPIEVLESDHQNKPDIGIAAARKWYDEGVNAIFDVGVTSVAVGVQQLAKEKNKLVVFISSASSDLTGKFCSPNGIHWLHNNYSLSLGAINTLLKDNKKSWYFMTVDYAYGTTAQEDATALLEAAGGKVIGATRHPFDATEFSSDLLKAQSSGAEVIAIATVPTALANIVKQSWEFGIQQKGQIVAPLALDMSQVKAIGLQYAQGLLMTEAFYWDQNDETRAFAKRFFERRKMMPNSVQASAYGAVMHYLKAVKAVGSDDNQKIIAQMKATPINDFMTKNGSIRADGRVIRDEQVFRVKKPADSKGEWDLMEQISNIPGEQAFKKADPAVCPLVKG